VADQQDGPATLTHAANLFLHPPRLGYPERGVWVDTTKLHFFHPEGGRNLAE
jgi:hypothetical protein